MSKKLKDVAERTFWTAAQAGVGYVATHLTGIPTVYTIPIATGLAALKGWIATHIGNPESASTVKAI